MEECPLCNGKILSTRNGPKDEYSVNCPRCGEYIITGSAARIASFNNDLRQKLNASSWIRENQGYKIHSKNIDNLFSKHTPSFHDRADKLLLAIEKETLFAGDKVDIVCSYSKFLSIAWCLNRTEIKEIIDYLISEKRIIKLSEELSDIGDIIQVKIIPAGWAHLEKMKEKNPDSKQGFVAMWFDETMDDVYYNAIAPAVDSAGYKPLRVDFTEHNEMIDDEIISQIRRSKFIIADLTNHNNGVYFEAGFAKGLGLDVVWTCNEESFKKRHFDIIQYNCIKWQKDNLEDLKKRLTNRIVATLGQGTYQPQPND